MRTVIFFFLTISSLLASAQKKPTQSEINKMMKEMQDNPEVKKAMQQAGISSLDDAGQEEWNKLPPKKTSKLAALPKTTLSDDNLKILINGIQGSIMNSLSTVDKALLKQVSDSTADNALLLSRAGIGMWYKNQPLQALALASKSAVLNPGHPEILNTLAAMLNLCGFQHKSIPILQNLLTKVPGNSTVLNNIGQAYLGLGDIQKAEQYLLLCVASSAKHVEANKSLGMIYKVSGQLTKAKSCIQKSLEGGCSQTTIDIARELGMDDESIDEMIIQSIKMVKAPEYFNTYKYQVPPLCESVGKAKEVAAEHKKFQVFLEQEIRKYEKLMKDEEEKINHQVSQIADHAKNGQLVRIAPSPMFEKGKRMFSYWLMKFNDFSIAELTPAYIKFNKEEYSLNQQYSDAYAKINMQNDDLNKCSEFDALATKYLELFAANQRNFMDILLTPYRGYMDELIFWSQYMNLMGDARARIFGLIKEYLSHLLGLSRQARIIFPSCQETPVFDFVADEVSTIEPECPIDISINLVVAEMEIDCDKLAFEVSAGFNFSAEKNFITKETTLALGIGIGTGKEFELPVIGIDAGAGISQQLYIVFDGNNSPSDVGMKMQGGIKIGAEASIGAISTDLGEISTGAGYSFGLNSGWNFSGSVPGVPGNLLK